MEHACPVFYNALPAYLSAELQQLQKCAIRIISPLVSYSDSLHQANLETLSLRRQSITTKLFDSITCNSDRNCMSSCHLVTIERNFNVPLAKMKRLKNTYTVTVINFLAIDVYIFLIFFVIFLFDFIIVTIDLIQPLAAILIRIKYLSI